MTYKQLSGLIRATLTKEQEDKEVEIRIGDQSYSNLYLVSTEEDLFLQPQPARTCTQNPESIDTFPPICISRRHIKG